MNKIAWVTGGRGGIGSAVVTALNNMGYETKTVGKSSKNDYSYDLSEHIRFIIGFIPEVNLLPDIIVTCHAAPAMASLEDIIDTDLLGVHNVCKHFISKMIKNEWGRIINLTSYHTQATYPDRMGYAAAKGGVRSYSRSLALTLAKYNITVNCVGASPVDTPRTRKFIKEGLINEDRIIKRTPLRRLAQPEDVANVVAFLASDKAEFITAQEWMVDGGYLASSFPGDY